VKSIDTFCPASRQVTPFGGYSPDPLGGVQHAGQLLQRHSTSRPSLEMNSVRSPLPHRGHRGGISRDGISRDGISRDDCRRSGFRTRNGRGSSSAAGPSRRLNSCGSDGDSSFFRPTLRAMSKRRATAAELPTTGRRPRRITPWHAVCYPKVFQGNGQADAPCFASAAWFKRTPRFEASQSCLRASSRAVAAPIQDRCGRVTCRTMRSAR
jgi:hypothetical protein